MRVLQIGCCNRSGFACLYTRHKAHLLFEQFEQAFELFVQTYKAARSTPGTRRRRSSRRVCTPGRRRESLLTGGGAKIARSVDTGGVYQYHHEAVARQRRRQGQRDSRCAMCSQRHRSRRARRRQRPAWLGRLVTKGDAMGYDGRRHAPI